LKRRQGYQWAGLLSFETSGVTSKAANGGRVKTGQRM
jgi:hypothetical protein